MSTLKRAIIIIGLGFMFVVVPLVTWSVSTSNRLVELDADVDQSWSQVENVLQRRYELIPNLVNSVEASMSQERAVFVAIADARKNVSEAQNTEDAASAHSELSEQLNILVNVIHEGYPELSSNENVKDLMTQLEGTENRITVERQRFNESVTNFNVTIRKIPTKYIAQFSGYESRALFEMTEGAEVSSEVNFNFND